MSELDDMPPSLDMAVNGTNSQDPLREKIVHFKYNLIILLPFKFSYLKKPDAGKSIRGYRIVIIILSVILVALSALYFSIHRQQMIDNRLLQSDRDSIQNDLGRLMTDFDNLQAHSITMNIVLNTFISTSYQSGWTSYSYGGRTYYINQGAFTQLDEVTRAAYERGVIVSGILLTSTGSIFNDPENTGGYYTMPNMTTPDAVNTYAAALNYLFRRYTSGEYGRVCTLEFC